MTHGLTVAVIGLTLALGACKSTTGPNAEAIEIGVVNRVCRSFTPIMDVTSKEVRAYNRGRYALCEPK